MKGTEKQIEWAEKIKTKMLGDALYQTFSKNAEQKNLDSLFSAKSKTEELYKFAEFLKNCEDSSWWISERGYLAGTEFRLILKGIANGGLNYKLEEIN